LYILGIVQVGVMLNNYAAAGAVNCSTHNYFPGNRITLLEEVITAVLTDQTDHFLSKSSSTVIYTYMP